MTGEIIPFGTVATDGGNSGNSGNSAGPEQDNSLVDVARNIALDAANAAAGNAEEAVRILLLAAADLHHPINLTGRGLFVSSALLAALDETLRDLTAPPASRLDGSTARDRLNAAAQAAYRRGGRGPSALALDVRLGDLASDLLTLAGSKVEDTDRLIRVLLLATLEVLHQGPPEAVPAPRYAALAQAMRDAVDAFHAEPPKSQAAYHRDGTQPNALALDVRLGNIANEVTALAGGKVEDSDRLVRALLLALVEVLHRGSPETVPASRYAVLAQAVRDALDAFHEDPPESEARAGVRTLRVPPGMGDAARRLLRAFAPQPWPSDDDTPPPAAA